MLACDFPVPVPTSQMVGHQNAGLKRRYEDDATPDSTLRYFSLPPKRPAHSQALAGPCPPSPSAPVLSTPSFLKHPAFAPAEQQPPTSTTTRTRTSPAEPASTSQSTPPVDRPEPHKRPFTSAAAYPPASLPPAKRSRPSPAPSVLPPQQPTTPWPQQHPLFSTPSTPSHPPPSHPVPFDPDVEDIPRPPPHQQPTPTATPATTSTTPATQSGHALKEPTPAAAGQLQLSPYLPPLAYNRIDLAPPIQQLLEEQLQAQFQLLQPCHAHSGAAASGALIVYDPTVAAVNTERLQQLAEQAGHLLRPRAATLCTIEEIDSGAPPGGSPPTSPMLPEEGPVPTGEEGAGGWGSAVGGPGLGQAFWGVQQPAGVFAGQQQQQVGAAELEQVAEQADMDVD